MWLVIIIIIAVIVFVVMNNNRNNVPDKDSADSVPAEVPGIFNFLQGFNALCANHKIYSTDVLISCKNVDGGCEISAYTKIFKIDDRDASDTVDVLRMTILHVKNSVEANHPEVERSELYQLKEKAAENAILSFFGTDHLKGSFWDITDCEYIDGKHLEFEDIDMVYNSFNQSLSKTLDLICTRTAEKYPNAQISRQGNNMIKISFS